MNKWRLLSAIGGILLLVVVSWPRPSGSDGAVLAEPVPIHDGIVLRVYFDDVETARKIAISYEPLQSNYEEGYLLLAVSPLEREELLAAGLRVEEDAPLTQQFAQPHEAPPLDIPGIESISGYSCYRTVEETYSTATSLVATYPTLASWTDVGDSWEKTQGLGGYDIYVLKLTNSAVPGPKPKIFITSAIHAREYTTAELTTRLAETLLASHGISADATWILDYHEVHFMLQANPDGRKMAETGLLWRKNTNTNYCSPTSNNRGADLNRNFPFNWGCCGGSSTDGCSATFRGASAASEPETQAVVSYIENNFVDSRGPGDNDAAPLDTEGIYLDIHSSGRLVLWPWGNTSDPAPNGTQLQTLGRKLAFFNGHTPQQSIGLYPTDGTTTSYAYGEMGLAAFTYELGTEFFESCSYFENTLVPDNIPSLMYALKVVRSPYITPGGPDAVSVELSAGSDPVGVPSGSQIILNASINDTRYNNSNGTEPSQTVTAAEYYLDTPPWDGGTAVSLTATDGSFSSSIEEAEATIDTTGFSQGQHILYVRGQDSAGNWGAISAIFLYIDDNAPPPPPPPITVFSDNFESNLGWTVDPSGSDTATTGQWERGNPQGTSNSSGVMQLDNTVSGENALVTGLLAGTSVGTYDIDNGETSIRSPNITLPSSGDLELSFSYYMAHLNNATTDDYLRVQVVGSSTTTVFEELGAANTDSAIWDEFSTSLNSYAGETVYLLISAADGGGGSLVEAAIDDVVINQTVTGPTPTPTNTAVPPTPTNTPVPTNTPAPGPTNTPEPPTATPTNTAVPPTATNTPVPTNTAVPTNTPEPGGAAVIYVSSNTGGNAGGVSFADEDILAFDTGSGTWSTYLDGSDVGLSGSSSRDVDAFALLDDGSILLSVVGATTLPDVGSVDDSDIVRFIPTSLGTTTAGTFEFYFDGSDVGLTSNGEDIDALFVLTDGRLAISTAGSYSVTGASGSDEDLFIFTPTSLGTTTAGSWAIAFDGSDVALNNSGTEDSWGSWYDEASGDIYLTARDTFSVSGVSGDGADVFVCTPSSTGATTACTFSLFWDGSANGFGGELADGLHIEP